MGGVVEINVLVVESAEEISKRFHLQGQVVASRKSAELPKKVGMAEGDVRGIVGPERETVGNGALVAVFLCHQRHHFVEDITLELNVAADAFVRIDPAGVETFLRVAVHTIKLEVAPADLIRDAVVHAQIFILAEVTVAGGKNEHLCAGVTDDEQAHVAFDTMTVPSVIFKVHYLGRTRLTRE
jgi:hypothetical protein